jgi:hypothetical protein
MLLLEITSSIKTYYFSHKKEDLPTSQAAFQITKKLPFGMQTEAQTFPAFTRS